MFDFWPRYSCFSNICLTFDPAIPISATYVWLLIQLFLFQQHLLDFWPSYSCFSNICVTFNPRYSYFSNICLTFDPDIPISATPAWLLTRIFLFQQHMFDFWPRYSYFSNICLTFDPDIPVSATYAWLLTQIILFQQHMLDFLPQIFLFQKHMFDFWPSYSAVSATLSEAEAWPLLARGSGGYPGPDGLLKHLQKRRPVGNNILWFYII